MTAPALTKLTITHLRGAVGSFALPFEKGKNLTVVYGENGTGKSTICDALELLGNGNVGSLDKRGLGRTYMYWNTISKTAADVAVSLETATTTCRATITQGKVHVQPPGARPRVEVLRRSQILDLLEAQAGARYEAIRRFIDVTGVEESEKALQQLTKDLRGSLDLAAARINENRGELERLAAAAGHPDTNALAWAERAAAPTAPSDDAELRALRLLQTAYERLNEHPARLLVAEQAEQSAGEDAERARQQSESALHDASEGAHAVFEILTAAQAYLDHIPDPPVCPVCESAENVRGLSARIAERMHAFESFQRAKTELRRAESGVTRARQDVERLRAEMQRDADAFARACDGFAWSDDIALPALPFPLERDTLVAWLAATTEVSADWQDAEALRQEQRRILDAVRGALHAYTENLESSESITALLPNLEKALEIVGAERKAYTDGVLATIAGDVARMYEAVHPREGIDKISLALIEGRRASLEIGSSFGGQSGLPPQAYFSQAHLDTLGICIFLALAKREDPANTILVLDDVLASVDQPHIDRLIQMLYAEVAQFRHCIVTTHYGPWRHKIRWGWLKHDRCQFVELSRWTHTGGMTLVRSVPEVERLRALLAEPSPDPQLVCAKAGVIVEAALDFLTYQYECDVPRKHDPRYTLGELLNAIMKQKKLRQALRVEVQEGTGEGGAPTYRTVPLGPMLEDLQRIAQARNVIGCHFSELSYDLLDADAVDFGQLVLTLIEALADPDAGWPGRSKTGEYWANAGETRRLYPLMQPS